MLNIIRATGAPYPIKVGGRTLMVSPPSLRGKGMILAYLATHRDWVARYREDHGGDSPPPDWIPRLSAELSIAILSGEGFPVLLYAATRADHPDIGFEEIESLAGIAIEDIDAMTAISLMGLTGIPGISRSDADPSEYTEYDGIESRDMGMFMASPSLSHLSAREISLLTEDQIYNAIIGGKESEGSTGYRPPGKPIGQDQAMLYMDYCGDCRRYGSELLTFDQWREAQSCR